MGTVVQEEQLRAVWGVGRQLKLSLNNLLAMEQAAFSASLGVVVANGVEVETFMAVLRGSAMHAKQFDKKLPKMLAHDYSNANFHTRHLLKDCALFRDEAAAAGLITAPQQVRHPPYTATSRFHNPCFSSCRGCWQR